MQDLCLYLQGVQSVQAPSAPVSSFQPLFTGFWEWHHTTLHWFLSASVWRQFSWQQLHLHKCYHVPTRAHPQHALFGYQTILSATTIAHPAILLGAYVRRALAVPVPLYLEAGLSVSARICSLVFSSHVGCIQSLSHYNIGTRFWPSFTIYDLNGQSVGLVCEWTAHYYSAWILQYRVSCWPHRRRSHGGVWSLTSKVLYISCYQ